MIWDLVHNLITNTWRRITLGWLQVVKFQMYDAVAVLSSIPSIREVMCTPLKHVVNGVEHLIIGASPEEVGFTEVQQRQCVEFFDRSFTAGEYRVNISY